MPPKRIIWWYGNHLQLPIEFPISIGINLGCVSMTARFDSPKFINANYSEIITNQRTVVILPFSSFTERLDKNCWEKVVSILVEKGYKCYTNIQNKSWDFKRHGHIKRNEIKQEYEPVLGTLLTVQLRISFLSSMPVQKLLRVRAVWPLYWLLRPVIS